MKLNTNSISANAVESVTEDGTEWLVADDVTIGRPKFLDGGYVPAASWRESADRWEGVPLPVGHPINEDGETVSVHANEAAEEQAEAGVLRNPRFDENEETISGDLWVNVEKTAALGHYGERVIEKLRDGEPLEVSTAYHGDDLGPGEYDGEWHPNAKANLRPDHVALLPDELGPGKCSREEGCGVPPQGDGADADPAATPTPGTYAVATNTASPVGGLCVNTDDDADADGVSLETDGETSPGFDVADDGAPDGQQDADHEGVVTAFRRLASTIPGVEVTTADAGAADGDADPSNGGDSQDGDGDDDSPSDGSESDGDADADGDGEQSTETMRAESRRDDAGSADAGDSDTHGDIHMDRETRIEDLVNNHGYKRESLAGMGDNCLERTHALATNSDDGDADPQDDDGDGDADPQDDGGDGGSPGDAAQDDDGGNDPQDDGDDPQDYPDDGDDDGSDASDLDEIAERLNALESENEDLRETVNEREDYIERLEEIVEERDQQQQSRHEELNERINAHTDAYSDDQLAEMTEEQKVSTLRALGAEPDAAVAANTARSGTDFGGVGGASPHMNVNNAGPGDDEEDEDAGTKHGGSFGDMLRGDGDD